MPIRPTFVNGIPTINGVDVTNVGRSFTSEEMTALGSSGHRYIFTERDQLGLSFSRSVRDRGRGNYRDCG